MISRRNFLLGAPALMLVTPLPMPRRLPERLLPQRRFIVDHGLLRASSLHSARGWVAPPDWASAQNWGAALQPAARIVNQGVSPEVRVTLESFVEDAAPVLLHPERAIW